MSAALHTPGLLRYQPSPGEPNQGRIVGERTWVASILHNGEAMPARQEADGRLWAAASGLAFQLLAAANYIDALGGDSKSYRIAYQEATGGKL